MGLSFSHILIVAFVVILLFGHGKISGLMGDLAAGIKSFKRAMNEPDDAVAGELAAKDGNEASKTV